MVFKGRSDTPSFGCSQVCAVSPRTPPNEQYNPGRCAYAAKGIALFPVPSDSKKSYKSVDRSDGRKWGMTRDPAEISADFTRWPDARIGIPTGAVNHIAVIETDTVEGHGVDGPATLAQLEAAHGPLPDTLKAISPSGSIHRYFRHPGDGAGNTALKPAEAGQLLLLQRKHGPFD